MKRISKHLSVVLVAALITASMQISTFSDVQEPEISVGAETIKADETQKKDLSDNSEEFSSTEPEDISQEPSESSATSEDLGTESEDESEPESSSKMPIYDTENPEQSEIPVEEQKEKSEVEDGYVPGYIIETEKTGGIFSYPVDARFNTVTQGYKKDVHDGIDIEADPGSDVFAVTDGKVTDIQYWVGSSVDVTHGYGNTIEITTEDGFVIRYTHLDTINVNKDDLVYDGDIIGTVSKIEDENSTFLHFEISDDSETFDPKDYITKCETINIVEADDITEGQVSENTIESDKPLSIDEHLTLIPSTAFVYNGEEQYPVIEVKARNETGEIVDLVEGTDYRISYMNENTETADIINVGKIDITIEGIGKFCGTVAGQYEIVPCSITCFGVEAGEEEIVVG